MIIIINLIFILLFLLFFYRKINSLKKLNEELIDINEITETIRSTVDLDKVLKLILSTLIKHFKFDRAFIFLKENEMLKGTIGIGVPYELLRIFEFPLENKNEIISKTVIEKKGFIIKDAKTDKRCLEKFVSLLDLNEFATIPLEAIDEVVGVLVVDKEGITNNDINKLKIFSNYAAIAIKNAILYSKVEKMSYTDGLTGLYNHRYFHEQIKNEIKKADEFSLPLSVIMIDIDNFKEHNDKNGHQYGDLLLKSLADIIKQEIKNASIPSRYGGDEIAIILPGMNKEEAFYVAEEIRKKAEKLNMTISIGISSYKDPANDYNELLLFADKSLYKAKQNGKNRTEIYK